MSRILVAGASGFLGAHAVRRFLDDGHEVAGFAPAPEPCLAEADLAAMAFFTGDATVPGEISAAVGDFGPDVVVGLAAHGAGGGGLMAAAQDDPAGARAVNADGFRNLLDACRARGVRRVLWAGTGAVFGGPDLYPDGRADDDSRPAPETAYGETKLRAEEIARDYRARGLASTGLRLPLLFGPGLWYRGAAARIADLFAAAARMGPEGGKAAFAAPDGPMDLAYVKDAAGAFAFLAAAPEPLAAIYNLHVCALTWRELGAAVIHRVPGLEIDTTIDRAARRFPVMRGDRLRALGFRPAWEFGAACADYLAELRAGSERA